MDEYKRNLHSQHKSHSLSLSKKLKHQGMFTCFNNLFPIINQICFLDFIFAMTSNTQESSTRYTRKQIYLLLVLMYANFWEASCYSLQAPFLPQIAQQKGVSATVYGFIFGILEFVILFTSPIFGLLVSY